MNHNQETDPFGHFVQTAKFSWTNGIDVWKYVSTKTGMSFVLANVEGPLVHGEFAIATEAHDDDGCPHTLEHLVFLGSEQYPYKGVLDSLANRCFSQGTNAWTDTDHTAYTVSTAGSEGFLALLPVYLDHILFPTLTDSGFHTEVHHITGTGEDAGVVYCEMQGRQNTCESLSMLRASQLIYPGDCGYKYETGGKVENLRDLTVHKVRDYHKSFYRPENLCLLITGQVPLPNLFQALHQVEQKILSKAKLPKWDRPWQSPVPPFTTSVTEKITFPSDDEESGMVVVAWRGPARRDFETYAALDIMWKYLTETAVAPLQQVFVEIDEPYCTDVDIDMVDHRNVVQMLHFENVDKDVIGEIRDLLFKTLQDIAKKGLDMNRIHDLIHRSILEHLDSVESNANHVICNGVIAHFLYGTNDTELEDFVESTKYLEVLKSKDESYWRNLLIKSTLETPYVCIEAAPSTKLAEKLQEDEKTRVAKQIATLGEAKLKVFDQDLQKAISTNNIPVPSQVLEQFQIPDVTKVNFIPLRSIRNDVAVTQDELTAQLVSVLKKDCAQTLPIDIQFDHVTSSLVEIRAVLDTSNIPSHLRPFLELYLDLLFELPVLRDGKLLSHEDVIAQLNRDTASYSDSLGFGNPGNFQCSVFGQYAIINIKTEISKYEQGVQWIRDLLWHSQFTVERLKIANAKLLGDIPQMKREGPVVCDAVMKSIKFDSKRSNHAALTIFAQNTFLEGLAKKLKSKKECNDVVGLMEEFRSLLCNPANLQIQVASDLLKLPHPKSPWVTHFTIPPAYSGSSKNNNKSTNVALSQALRSSHDNKGYVVGLGAVESGYLTRCADCIASYTHPDLPAVTVAAEFLEALEGPFWKLIRGLGLAYGFGIRPKVEEGMLYFTLYRSTNVNGAYQQAVNIVNDILARKSPIDKVELSAAISNAIFGIIQREASIPDTVEQSLLNYMKNVGPNGNKELLKKLQQVTLDDVYRVIEQYFKPLFQNPSTTVVVMNPSKVKETSQFFKELTEVSTPKKLNSIVRSLLE